MFWGGMLLRVEPPSARMTSIEERTYQSLSCVGLWVKFLIAMLPSIAINRLRGSGGHGEVVRKMKTGIKRTLGLTQQHEYFRRINCVNEAPPFSYINRRHADTPVQVSIPLTDDRDDNETVAEVEQELG